MLGDEQQQQFNAEQIQGLPQAVSHCNEEFYANTLTILQRLLTCSCMQAFLQPTEKASVKPGSEQACLILNGLALAYIHKPTDIDSSSVSKRWDASGHRRMP